MIIENFNAITAYILFIAFLNMQSESIWKKEKSMLEEDASNISILKKEITKETEIDASVQSSINEKIQNLKQNAAILAKKLQNEKHKNGELELIIRHMRGKMEQQRFQCANSRDNINSENIISLENRFKKLQYDLGQINSKVNRMSENLEQKKSKISQNRTERVIDSGIFRNIEKELINSELTFKKLLIEKIKFQKQYQKLLQEYNSLKDKADLYYGQKDSSTHRSKTNKEMNAPLESEQSILNYKRKFLEVETCRRNNRVYTMNKVDEELIRQEQNKTISLKKLLIKTNLQNCGDLIHYFNNIEEINEKYFNQINIYADQSNQIEKYLEEAALSKKQRHMKFGSQQPVLTKNQLNIQEYKDKKEKMNGLKEEIDQQVKQFASLFESENFKIVLQGFNIEPPPFDQDGYTNFDSLKETLRQFDSNVSEILREPIKFEEENNTTARNNNGPEKLEEMINKVRKNDECFKVMKKQEFQDEYQKLVKNMSQKTVVARSVNKKKSFPMLKK